MDDFLSEPLTGMLCRTTGFEGDDALILNPNTVYRLPRTLWLSLSIYICEFSKYLFHVRVILYVSGER